MTKKSRKAVAYVRAFPAETAEADKVSEERQRAAIAAYAMAAGIEVAAEFSDPAVFDADPIPDRPGFAAMLAWAQSNDARTIIVHDPEHLARDLITHLDGYDMLKEQGITVIAASSPAYFLRHSPGFFCNTLGRSAPGPVRSGQ